MKEATENTSLEGAGWSQAACEDLPVSESRGEQGGPNGLGQPLPASTLKRGSKVSSPPKKSTLGMKLVPCKLRSDAVVVGLRDGIFKYVDGAESP